MHPDTLKLVGQIYDAVSEPDKWKHFLDDLACACGAQAVRMRMAEKSDKRYSLIAGTGHDRSFDYNYQQYYSTIDVWNPTLEQSPPGEVLDTHRFVPDNIFKKTEIYNDFYRHYDVFYGLGSNLINNDDYLARIGIHRASSQGPFGDEDRRLLSELMPHLIRGFKLSQHLDELRSQLGSFQEVLYTSSTPFILIDENEQAAFINRRAEVLINHHGGLTLHGRRLRALQKSVQTELQAIIHQAVVTGSGKGVGCGGGLRVSSDTGDSPLNLIVTPYPSRPVESLGFSARICAAVFIHDTTLEGHLSAGLLKTLYGLSPAESRLAECLVEGLSPGEAAAKIGVSVNTTRTQLRSLFTKTETQRQSELVRLLSGLTGLF